MTPDERRDELRAELAALGVPADDITQRLLDRVDHYTRAVDLDCMRAVDEILALRDQLTACRLIIKAQDNELQHAGRSMLEAANSLDEMKRELQLVRDMLPEEVTDV